MFSPLLNSQSFFFMFPAVPGFQIFLLFFHKIRGNSGRKKLFDTTAVVGTKIISPVFCFRLPSSTADGRSGRAIRCSRRVLGGAETAAAAAVVAAWNLCIRRLAILLSLGCRGSVVFSEAGVVSAATRVGCQIPKAGCQIPNVGCQISKVGCQIPKVGCQIPKVGCQIR